MFKTFLAMHVTLRKMKNGQINPVQAYLRIVASNGSALINYRQKLHHGVANYFYASSKFLPIPLTQKVWLLNHLIYKIVETFNRVRLPL